MTPKTPQNPPQGAEAIRRALKTAPAQPGVYRMLNARGDVLYVGKARQLKNRLSSYARADGHSWRIRKMVSETVGVEIVTTASEAEALLLECNLIKKLKPRYNILLRDDKSFPFLLLTGGHPYPRIVKHRGARKEKGKYFGPFASVGALNQSLALMQKAFLLRPCSDSIFNARTRPCLQYQIKRCSAPCVGRISEEDYARQVRMAEDFLRGKSQDVQQEMARQMQQASDAMDYETAARFRDRIRAIAQVQAEQGLSAPGLGDADVLALARQGDDVCVQVFFFRGGQNFGNRAYFPAHTDGMDDAEVLEGVIGQFYQTHPPPKKIVLPVLPAHKDALEHALSQMAGRRVEIAVPARGALADMLKLAAQNAAGALERRLAESATQRALLEKLGELFGLEATPERIEIYDNSHVMGSAAIGAMVVAGPEGFIKNAYRTFTIKDKAAMGDDFAMLREVLTRRLKALQENDPGNANGTWPDLLLIDGGQGQLSAAMEALADLGLGELPVVCISKGPDRNAGREKFHMPGREPFQLPPGDAVLFFLQRLRDEAHRFAIGTHRKKRGKEQIRSELDAIEGIGPTRKRALLHHFGSGRAVGEASLEELQRVKGISSKVAETVYNHFHEK